MLLGCRCCLCAQHSDFKADEDKQVPKQVQRIIYRLNSTEICMCPCALCSYTVVHIVTPTSTTHICLEEFWWFCHRKFESTHNRRLCRDPVRSIKLWKRRRLFGNNSIGVKLVCLNMCTAHIPYTVYTIHTNTYTHAEAQQVTRNTQRTHQHTHTYYTQAKFEVFTTW